MTKYCQDKVDEICRYISQGLTQKDAAQLAGIRPQTISEWKSSKPEFAEALQGVELDFKRSLIQKLVFARSHQAHQWLLERKFPDEFQPPKQRHESEVTHKKAEESDVAKFLKAHPEVTEQVLDSIEKGLSV